MSLVVYNTLSREKEAFAPIDAGHVRLYVCGPTVYDYVHIGNARPVVVFDTLYRLLKRHYPRVTYVRNITDIDDRIIVRAADNEESIEALTDRTSSSYRGDMLRLGALAPDHEPRAT
ncbi:MAG: cysteine--tRNA ligase, partial [Rhodospirillales bacterium]|nr:cysteine--tRNA ligase [Rhodospirillales bacterium]